MSRQKIFLTICIAFTVIHAAAVTRIVDIIFRAVDSAAAAHLAVPYSTFSVAGYVVGILVGFVLPFAVIEYMSRTFGFRRLWPALAWLLVYIASFNEFAALRS